MWSQKFRLTPGLLPVMCPSDFCQVRGDSEPQALWVRFESESSKIFLSLVRKSHDLVESSQGRVTRTVKSLRVIGLQTRVNVESNEISHFFCLYFGMKWRPTCYKVVPDKVKNVAQCCFSKFDCRYLYLSSLWKQFASFLSLSLSVISTSLPQPYCKKYTSLCFTCPKMKMTRDEHVLGFKSCVILLFWWIWMLSFLLNQILDYDILLNFFATFG